MGLNQSQESETQINPSSEDLKNGSQNNISSDPIEESMPESSESLEEKETDQVTTPTIDSSEEQTEEASIIEDSGNVQDDEDAEESEDTLGTEENKSQNTKDPKDSRVLNNVLDLATIGRILNDLELKK